MVLHGSRNRPASYALLLLLHVLVLLNRGSQAVPSQRLPPQLIADGAAGTADAAHVHYSSSSRDYKCRSTLSALSPAQLEAAKSGTCSLRCKARSVAGALLERCTSICLKRVQRAQQHPLAKSPSKANYSDWEFVVFFAVGDRLAEKYPHHQFMTPNLAFLPVVQRSHPGARVTLLTSRSQDVSWLPPEVDVFRFDIDTARMGRNAWANWYQYKGEIAYLRHLAANGARRNIVFMDMDVLVLDTLDEVFCHKFAMGMTINADMVDPVDVGIRFVKRTHYEEAALFMEEVLQHYKIDQHHPIFFTIGQWAVRDAVGISGKDKEVARMAYVASTFNHYCRRSPGGAPLCFFPCVRYNYCEDCGPAFASRLPNTAQALAHHGVKVLQFTAWRKPGLDLVARAYLQGGLPAAHAAFAALPHTEEGYNATFGFNSSARRICFSDDPGCQGEVALVNVTVYNQYTI